MARVRREPWVRRLDGFVALLAVFGWATSAALWTTPTTPSDAHLWARSIDVALFTSATSHHIQGAIVLVAASALALGRARGAAELTLVFLLHAAAVLEASGRGTAMSTVEVLLIGQVLAARVVARAIALRGGGDADALARELACGAVAAAFFVAAIAKLAATGLSWVSPASQTLLVYERQASVLAPVAALRSWLVEHPLVVGAGATFSLAVELSGPAFIVPRLRLAWAIAALSMFASVAIALGVVQITWAALPLALAVWGPTRPGTARLPPTPTPAP